MKNQISNSEITVSAIFNLNQVLTYEVAKTLVGKRIATTHPVYKGNQAQVEFVTITGFASEWDFYAKPTDECKGFSSRQEYWKSFMTDKQIAHAKSTILVLGEDGEWGPHYFYIDLNNPYFNAPTATCSDSDREVYFMVVNDED